MKLIFGLGNPGSKYQTTRHNIGFRAVDVLAGRTKWQANKKFNAHLAAIKSGDEPILLAKPQTGMNESGRAARLIMDFYKLNLADVLTIYDDIDLLVGDTRLRLSGGSGGHNGLASVITHLGTETIARLRIGIAEEKTGKQAIPAEDYVLQPFGRNGEIEIKTTLAKIPELILPWLFPKNLLVA